MMRSLPVISPGIKRHLGQLFDKVMQVANFHFDIMFTLVFNAGDGYSINIYSMSKCLSRGVTASQMWISSEISGESELQEERKTSRGGSHEKWMVISSQRPDDDEGRRRLIDFSSASKWCFMVRAPLGFMEELLSPDTCSGIDATGPSANIPPLWNRNELLWSLNKM